MIFESFVETRKQKIREQALYEAEVVNAVKKHLDDKISGFDDISIELNSTLKERELEFLAKKREGASERDLKRLGRACDRITEQITHNDNKTDDFERVREVIYYLEMYVQTLIDYELYEYLIRAIPEKKLPAMINSEQLKMVVDLVTVIMEKIEKKMLASGIALEELEAKKKKVQEVCAIMKSNHFDNSATKDSDTRAEEIAKKYGMTGAGYTMPASATETANVNATNHNKA
jgi:hypothetical protein